jgi:hypothetical protein
MAEGDKPFIAWRQGRWGLKIVPRTAAGWRAFGLWMLSLFPICGLFIAMITREPEGAALLVLVVIYMLALIIWGIAMTRWMLARAEVVRVEELLDLKRQMDAQKRRR